MERQREQQNPDQPASNKLIQLIRKLRWLGLEEEAQKLENKLTLRNVPASDSVVAGSRETD
jgi:hypothetical protein